MTSPDAAPDCLKCRHFYVTWDPAFPRGCKMFELKVRTGTPAFSVYNATGQHCPAFEQQP